MALIEITSGLPVEVTSQLMRTEKVYYFSFIAFQGGCGSYKQKENYWLALTDKRVIYKTKVSELDSIMQNLLKKMATFHLIKFPLLKFRKDRKQVDAGK